MCGRLQKRTPELNMGGTVIKVLFIMMWKTGEKKKTVSNDLEDMTKISGQIVESASWLLLATLNKIQEDKNGLKTILFNFFFSGI